MAERAAANRVGDADKMADAVAWFNDRDDIWDDAAIGLFNPHGTGLEAVRKLRAVVDN